MFDRCSLLVDFYTSERKREKADNCSIRYCVLINENARGEQSERGSRGTAFIFISGEVVSCAFSLLALGPIHEERVAHVLRLPLLTGHRHLFTVVGRPCSLGASAAPSSVRCIIKYGQTMASVNRV